MHDLKISVPVGPSQAYVVGSAVPSALTIIGAGPLSHNGEHYVTFVGRSTTVLEPNPWARV